VAKYYMIGENIYTFYLLSNKIFLSLMAAGPRSCNGAACASLQQSGFAIAVIPPVAEPNRRRRLTHELVKSVQHIEKHLDKQHHEVK
jgi:hypothetical protein